MANKRIYFAIEELRVAPIGTAPNGYTTAHTVYGLQSVGVNTRFNLEHVFEIGQLAQYENVEEVPDIEITTEKVLDGRALVYHLSTPGVTSATLAGRSNVKSQVLLSIFDDTSTSASGTPIKEVECSGMFVSSVAFTFPVQGNCTESCTLVGNNKTWRNGSGTGGFPTNTDAPTGSGGVNRRQDVLFGSGQSIIPLSVAGISSIGGTGFNVLDASGNYGAHIQSIKVTANLGRDKLSELGRKGPYHRFINFPVEIKTDIECYTTSGDLVQALEEADNLTNEKIKILLREGLIVDLGSLNKLDSVSYTGGNAGTSGGNVTVTYSFTTFNDFVIKHPSDPAVLASGITYP